jgi:hypothetical protein
LPVTRTVKPKITVSRDALAVTIVEPRLSIFARRSNCWMNAANLTRMRRFGGSARPSSRAVMVAEQMPSLDTATQFVDIAASVYCPQYGH